LNATAGFRFTTREFLRALESASRERIASSSSSFVPSPVHRERAIVQRPTPIAARAHTSRAFFSLDANERVEQ
jgi:hypothetical protein|tara:strand:- start:2470 stop:2688 length:219 start_codon:yes stop_codon:yes gene_type:complete